MVLKSVWKLPKLQAQTSQFEMTVHADEHKYEGYICSYYEFATECKFIWYRINQNRTLNRLLKAWSKNTPLHLQTGTPRVHLQCSFYGGIKSAQQKRPRQKRNKITIQRNSARQHKVMSYGVVTQKIHKEIIECTLFVQFSRLKKTINIYLCKFNVGIRNWWFVKMMKVARLLETNILHLRGEQKREKTQNKILSNCFVSKKYLTTSTLLMT